jgi:probable HAF family extracellular repeat protein
MKSNAASHTWLVAALVLAAVVAPAAGQLVTRYELTELTYSGATQSRAYALNDTGQVIGWIDVDNTRRTAHWHNGEGTDLHTTVHFQLQHPLFDQDYSESFDISNADQVVGTARTEIKCPAVSFVVTHGFILRPAVLTDLGSPYPGDALINLWTFGNPCNTAYDSAAVGVSNANHVCGWADLETGVIHAFLVVPTGGAFFVDADANGVNDIMWDLGTLAASDPVSSATAVNDKGLVTGYTYTVLPGNLAGYRAFLVTPQDLVGGDGIPDTWFVDGGNGVNTLMADLGTLNGVNSWGRDINNAGQVVGESDYNAPTGQRYTRAFLWQTGTMYDLGTLRDDPTLGFSSSSGINEAGTVVGWAENEDGERRAFIYQGGQMQDLNDLLYLYDANGNTISAGITLTEARDINEDGLIVGWGRVKGGTTTVTRGFLLTPKVVDLSAIPQPTTGTTGSNGAGYNGDPTFGVPEHLDGSSDDGDGSSGGSAGVPVLCGPGTLTVLPLTVLGLLVVRRRG